MNRHTGRLRRLRKTRGKIRQLRELRLSVHRTLNHTYAQLLNPVDGTVIASASTLEAALKGNGHGGNINSAIAVGKLIAERAVAKGVSKVVFDRSGFRYHGRVRALADAARAGGLEF
jgi:large subunit ribosomal protein L18